MRMIQTKQPNSLETISFRVLIAISFLCLIFGSGIAFFEYHTAQDNWKFHDQYKKENDRRATPEFNSCIMHANSDIEVNGCYKIYAPDIEELQRLTNAALTANHWVSIGLVILLIPIPLFLIYFILRWIITGRWRQAKE